MGAIGYGHEPKKDIQQFLANSQTKNLAEPFNAFKNLFIFTGRLFIWKNSDYYLVEYNR